MLNGTIFDGLFCGLISHEESMVKAIMSRAESEK